MDLQEVLRFLNALDKRAYEGDLDYREVMREIRGFIVEIEIVIGEEE